ncbi:MAG TPA: Spy/CpxP family protein refolding chaperone [Hyphomicrobiaceae bacterium]|nr:Spy/CpxP family protein refolding chaperone [Hyphomicrobiaceae bacterium]
MNAWLKMAGPAAIAMSIAGFAVAQGGPPADRGSDNRGWGMGWHMGPGSGMGPGWGMGPGGGMWGWGRGGNSAWMLERIEGQLAYVKAELKITGAQNAAWNELADAVRTAAKHHNERMQSIFGGGERGKTLPERVEAQEQFMTVRLDEIKSVKSAVNKLYAVLSDEQKKDADDVGIPMVGMMRGPWG